MASDHFTVIAPGRVNLLGEHVDYCGGPVLPVAIDRWLKLIVRPAKGERPVVLWTLPGGEPMPYAAAVRSALLDAGLHLPPLEAGIESDIPIGAGLSSSAAIEVALVLAWQELGGWHVDRMTLARICQRAENQYVGVACGLMDQFAVLHGVEGHALYFDTRTLAWDPVPLPKGTVIVIADSGVRRELANSAYNERRKSCEEALALLRERIPGLQCLADVTLRQLEDNADVLSETIFKRARHVVEECARVKSAVSLLRAGDPKGFGALMYEGHASLRDLYEVSTKELDLFVDITRTFPIPGCYGARLTGAGFGGCLVNLVDKAHADEWVRVMDVQLKHCFGETACAFATRAVDGAHVVRE